MRQWDVATTDYAADITSRRRISIRFILNCAARIGVTKMNVKDFPHLNISVSNLLQSNATPEDMENHIDIADWLIR